MPRPVGRTAEWSLFSVALRPDGLPRHASGLRRPGRASTRAIYLVLRGGPSVMLPRQSAAGLAALAAGDSVAEAMLEQMLIQHGQRPLAR
jgi:hypothetical protein